MNILADLDTYLDLPTQWVKTADELYELIDEIDSVDRVALDTEFIRRDTYFPILALVQVNTGKGVYLVDAPRLSRDGVGLGDFWQALCEVPQMVWYACGEDLGIFYQLADCPPLSNVLDVQIGVAYLTGELHIGYSCAVQDFLGVVLDKGESQSDWLARPLSESQERYAIDDVRYLFALADKVEQALSDKGLTAYVAEDCQTYAKELHETCHETADKAYLNFIAPNYTHEQITVLQTLCEWRETLALASNIPPSFVIGKQPLREIILILPKTFKELSTTTLNRGSLRRYGDEILAIIKTARALPISERPPMPSPNYTSRDKPFKNELKALIDTCSQDTNVPTTLILKNRWIDELLWAVAGGGAITSHALCGYRRAWVDEKVLPLFEKYKDDIVEAMGLARKMQGE